MDQSGSDFQQGGYTSQPIIFTWTPEHLRMSDKPQKQTSIKVRRFSSVVLVIVVSLLTELFIDDETVLCHSVCKW